MGKIWPDIVRACGPQRKRTSAAMSAGLTKRLTDKLASAAASSASTLRPEASAPFYRAGIDTRAIASLRLKRRGAPARAPRSCGVGQAPAVTGARVSRETAPSRPVEP
jgi:hypothetical protein